MGFFLRLALVSVLLGGVAEAAMFQTVSPEQAQLLQAGPGRLYCPSCGMNLVKFYKTSHAMTQPDGAVHQYCSLHCLVDANERLDADVLVVDTATLQFIKAVGAHYVVGSGIKGTMTMNSKYAFGTRQAADDFVLANGGQVMTFSAAEKIARSALAKENAMVAKKRGAMAEKGRKIFAQMCADVDLPTFESIAAAKTYLSQSGACGELKDEQFQALAIYVVSRSTANQGLVTPLLVPDDAKCPVCGMFVAKYPEWAAMIETEGGRKYYFDGVKDLMKFYFDPARYHGDLAESDLAGIMVTDYYTLKAVPGRQAWYVVGANVYGPMGNELIPFATEQDAVVFMADHLGKRALPFAEITADLVHDLDR